ncbi:MAG: bifunctional pyr operon transcriptional regulator/uracil phosphoribosyltransferase PyrR [Deltaproteobacteria bacterium]|nr:bifunctional pyr operon transcriptional regulator/uracil phosphoribosyltransferase PyrR [Deltaproteobacteria bacterium]
MKTLLDQKQLAVAIQQMAQQISQRHPHLANLIFVGIQRRGVILAQRLIHFYQQQNMLLPSLGTLDINLYRDDFSSLNKVPVVHATEISESIHNKGIILIDEVLYTGRTIRAAMDALMDLGRPRFIELAVLVDRGGRELPIQANYVSLVHPIGADEEIQVRFQELDGEEGVRSVRRDP